MWEGHDNTKYSNINIIEDGGWHFTQLKTPKDIEIKLLNGEQYAEYKKANKNLQYITDLVKRKSVDYDHMAKTSSYKYNKEFKLITLGIDQMPPYIKNNQTKYKDWLDFN